MLLTKDECERQLNKYLGRKKIIRKKNYSEIREIVLDKQNNKCQLCGKKASSIHHKNKNHKDNRFNNLILVCPKCHKTFHPSVKYFHKDKNNKGKREIKEKNDIILTIRLSIKMHERLREISYTRNISINKIILEAIIATGIEQ